MPVTYLSYIANAGTTIGGQGEPHAEALAMYDLLCDDPAQKRPVCIWSDEIAAVAQARCDAMLRQGAIFINHLDGNNRGPNKWLRDAGVPIPDYYSHYPGQQGPKDHENNVESIGLNYLTAALCWQGWLASPDHRAHVLGYAPTFVTQTQVGCAFAVGAELYPRFWILLSVPPEQTPWP